jgi:hypothetical protein
VKSYLLPFITAEIAAMRMVLEVVMLLALVGGLFFVMNVMAKENKEEKALAKRNEADGKDEDFKSEPPESEN